MESRIKIPVGPLTLEGLLNPQSKSCGVVITHPHPLYGGNMANPVVESIAFTYARKRITTLRFNFRGTGSSEGIYDNGEGEQDDVLAAIALLRSSGIKEIHLVGYSFGTWVNSRIESLPPEVSEVIMVAPPIAFMDFTQIGAQPRLTVVLAGSDDELAPPERIKQYLPRWNPDADLEIIDDADHFFYGRFPQLEAALAVQISFRTPK
jgi:uncharacterized protein